MLYKKALMLALVALVPAFGWGNLNAQTLQEILSKHMQALGGEEALKAQKNSITNADVFVPGGLSGKVKIFFKYPDKLRSETDLKIMKELSVYDGDKGWVQDANGQVRQLAGMELEETKSQIYFNLYAYLFPERAKGKVEYLGREKTGDIDYYVLQVTPEACDPVKFFINPETYLIDKTISKSDVVVITNYLSDYKDFGGIKVATSMRINMGDSTYDIRSTLTGIESNPQLSDELFQMPSALAKTYHFPPGQNSVEIPFVLNSNHIYIPVSIGDSKPMSFILDTGAGSPVLETEVAKELGLKTVGKIEGRGVGEGTQEINLLSLPSIRLGDLVIDSTSAMTISLQALSKYEGMPDDGILGYDIFSKFVVKVDYENQKLTLYDPSSFQYTGKGQILPITLEENSPHVKAKIDGEYEGNFVVDTGARTSLVLHTPFVQKSGLLAKTGKKLEVFSGIGIGGKAPGKVTRVKSIEIGNFNIPAPVTTLSSSEKGAFASQKLDGNIGGGILKKFTVIFDYPGQRMILEPNANFSSEDDYDMSGLWLTKEGDTTRVDFVIKESPADKKGIKEGDVILKINGQATKDLLLRDIRNQLREEPGKKVSLTINREGKEKNIELELMKLI